MAIGYKELINQITKTNSTTIPKLGRPYLLYSKEKFNFIIPIAYTTTGILSLNIQKINSKDRAFVLKNIQSLKFSKKYLTKVDLIKTKFFEIDQQFWNSIEHLSYKEQ